MHGWTGSVKEATGESARSRSDGSGAVVSGSGSNGNPTAVSASYASAGAKRTPEPDAPATAQPLRPIGVTRFLQSGYIYHYAFAMIIGMLGLLTLFVTLGGK
ncbi:hypothetical protein G3O06_46920 [Burkholderia sp. Ac-20345]|uniref:hypothetical protein n=1 Tax=Burkholderia sp. Ac-20345 TaxID=2703891 RepID=UPI00197C9E38|nr:hypothetical protein [Burkholderia sp. Ac-20345]MBN3784982.1 hypothetical protein [Burkholderia sp. Ac-20345]